MRLKRLIEDLDNPQILNFRDFKVKGMSCNSQSVKEGFVFIAIKGTNDDGHCFIGEAIKNGAKAIISQGKPQLEKIPSDCSWISVNNSRVALARLASSFYGYPSRKLKVIGVTGTNGKTTITYLIENLLKEAGYAVGVLGTINYRFKEKIIPAHNTTPGPLDIQSLLSQMKEENMDYVVMEVSSHALEQDRILGIDFAYAIFTNLTQDHLDYHLDMESYFKAKAKLFQNMAKNKTSIINLDDSYGRQLIDLTPSRIITYGLDKQADISARNIKFNFEGTSFTVVTAKGEWNIRTDLIGRYNIYNILASLSLGFIQGLEPEIIKSAIEKFKLVPGRLERIDCGQAFYVFVDYAHTDDALKNVLSTLRELAKAKIIVVFGCGGNRDKGKRPKMGRVVSEWADFAIVTSDNPRDEEPEDIIKDIIPGIQGKNYKIIPERQTAIFESLHMAKSDDIVLIAGKGHEDCQIIKGENLHFDDREIVRQCLRSMS